MAYATEGKAATSRRRYSSPRTTSKQTAATLSRLITKMNSGSSLQEHLQSQGELKDEHSGESRSRPDQGDDTLIYTAQFDYDAQKSIDLSFSKGKSPSQVVSRLVATQCFIQRVGCPGISHSKLKFPSPQALVALPCIFNCDSSPS